MRRSVLAGEAKTKNYFSSDLSWDLHNSCRAAGCAETWVNSQNTKPGLLVANASGGGGHALDGLWQEVNCRSQKSFNVNTSEPNTSSQSSDVSFFFFLTVKLSPPRVREQRVHDLVRVAAPVAVLHHMSQHAPQNIVQSGSFLIQEDARLGQEAVQVSVGTHFLLEVHRLHILVRAKNNRENIKFCCCANKILKVSLLIFVFSPSSELILTSPLLTADAVWVIFKLLSVSWVEM